MPSVINYEKYKGMSQRQLFNSLINAKKKLVNLQEKFKLEISNQQNLISFLNAEMKASLEEPKEYTLATAPALKKNDEWAKANPDIAAQADKELEAEMKGYYANNNTAQG